MAYAAIDLGSNSILLSIESQDGVLLHDQMEVVGLGRGLGDMGRFSPERMAHARRLLGEYVRTAARHGVPASQIVACATSGARRATNAQSFFDQLRQELGLRIRTISGQEEAKLSYLGATRGLSLPAGPVLLIDVGGGSTEIVIGEGDTMHFHASLEVGAVRLTESYGLDTQRPQRAAALAHLQRLLQAIELPLKPTLAVAVAGTATTLAAMSEGLKTYDGRLVHGRTLTVEELHGWSHRLLSSRPEQRLLLAQVSPKRAGHLAGGALTIASVLSFAGLLGCTVSDAGLRFGLLKMAHHEG